MITTNFIATRFATRDQLTIKQKRLLHVIGLSLILCFSPFKELGQIVSIFLIFAAAGYASLQSKKSFLRLFFLTSYWFIVGAFYYLVLPEFSFANHYLWLLTMSAFLILLIDFREIISANFLQHLRPLVAALLFFESSLGIIQGIIAFYIKGSFDTDSGDLVRGTLELGFDQNATASNPIFAILLTSMFLFLISTQKRISWMDIICYFTFFCAWILSSVLHVYIYLCISVVVATSLYIFRDVRRSIIMSTLFVAFSFTLWFYILPILMPNNVSQLSDNATKLMDISETSKSLKSRVTYNTIFELPQNVPLQPLIGLGPGQYSSRAALMASGYYLNGNFIYHYMSEMSYRYIIQPFTIIRGTAFSSTHFPFYSWLTIYGELGLVGITALLFYLSYFVFFILKHRTVTFPAANASLLCMIFFVSLLGFQDNYWEFTQAITPIVLFIALLRDFIKIEKA